MVSALHTLNLQRFKCHFAFQETNRFHEDIFGVTLRTSEVHDKKRDEARKHFTKSTLSQPSEDRATRN